MTALAVPISRGWIAVWRRNFLVWRKLAAESVLGNIIEPLFYLLGFGMGFGAMVPESSLHAGANDVSVYAVNGGTLTELPGSDVTYSLANGALQASNGTSIPVGRSVSGEVRGTRASDGSTLGGWAGNVKTHKPATSIVVLVDGKSVFVGDNGNITRKDILKRYGIDKAGFIFRLPGELLPQTGATDDVRVFAIAGAAASELEYLPGYPWKT